MLSFDLIESTKNDKITVNFLVEMVITDAHAE